MDRPATHPECPYAEPVLDRFWSKVDIRGPDECWPWTAYRHKDGYGRFQPGGRDVPKQQAHRLVHVMVRGPIPAGMSVRQSCDEPWCCNPAHVVAATHAECMARKAAKGTLPIQTGDKAPNRKLTAAKVRAIRSVKDILPIGIVASEHGVVKSVIQYIWDGRTWDVPEAYPDPAG